MDSNLKSWSSSKNSYIESIKKCVVEIDKLRDIEKITNQFLDNEMIEKSYISDVDPKTGIITINLNAPNDLYNKTLKDIINIDIKNKADLLSLFQEYNIAKKNMIKLNMLLKW